MEKKKTRIELYRISIINILTLMALIVFITEVGVFFDLKISGNLSVTPLNYLIRYILIPNIVNIISILVALGINYSSRFNDRVKNYSPVVFAGIMSLGIASSHNFFITSLCGTFIPVILVSVYGERKMIRNITIMSYFFLAIATIIAKLDSQKDYKYLFIEAFVVGIIITAVYLCGVTTVNLVKENFEEIEERIMKEKQLTEQLLRDQLTGLYNHTAFYRFLEAEIEECKKFDKKLSLAVVDIDNFKIVNDVYGHENGNIVLIHLADFMKEICQEPNIVCRYGGEEFTVIFPNTDSETARTIMEKVRWRFEKHNFMFMPSHHVTISCGICEVELDNRAKADELFRKADELMYQAKHNGKNQVIAI